MSSATKKNSLLQAWSQTLGQKGETPALLAPDGEVRRSFAQIEREASGLEQELARFAPGSILAIQIGNSCSWPALLLAAFRRGLIPLPMGRHVEKTERDLIFESLGVAGLVWEPEYPQHEDLRIDSVPRTTPPRVVSGFDFLKLTSGTTSDPRAIRFQASQLLADCLNICATMGIGPGDLNFGVIPLSHSYGFSNLLTPLIACGVPLVVSDDRMPRAILEGLLATGATVFPGMPVFFDKFAALSEVPRLPKLRLCISAGAPLSKATGEAFTRKFGVKIHTFYGASECGGICYDRGEEPVYQDGFLGQPMENVKLELLENCRRGGLGGEGSRSEKRPEVAPGGLTEATYSEVPYRACVRSAAVGDGYFPEPEPEVIGEGRFVPSDLVRPGPDGFTLAGRVSDIINVAGRKLNPAEVESQLMQFPGVRQAVVFGVASSLRNEMPVACVAGQFDRAAFQAFAHQRLSSWQVPKEFWFVEEIPANERGKISRRELAARYQAQA
jgi:acyl-CoA synthetase (AMP-forming)/AMP-acid ligase II